MIVRGDYARLFSLSLILPPISRQFFVSLSGGNIETLSSAKVLRIYFNDVDYAIANHTFHEMATEYSISMGPNQMLVGVHAVHSDVFIHDCPREFFQASAGLARPRVPPAPRPSRRGRSLTLFSIRISRRLLSARPFSPLHPSFLLHSRQTVLLDQVPELPAAAAAASTPPSP